VTTRLIRLTLGAIALAQAASAQSVAKPALATQTQQREQEIGSWRSGDAIVWVRVAPTGAISVYASHGYRSAFAHAVYITPDDAERWADVADHLAAGQAVTPVVLADSDLAIQPDRAGDSTVLNVRLGGVRPGGITFLMTAQDIRGVTPILRETARASRATQAANAAPPPTAAPPAPAATPAPAQPASTAAAPTAAAPAAAASTAAAQKPVTPTLAAPTAPYAAPAAVPPATSNAAPTVAARTVAAPTAAAQKPATPTLAAPTAPYAAPAAAAPTTSNAAPTAPSATPAATAPATSPAPPHTSEARVAAPPPAVAAVAPPAAATVAPPTVAAGTRPAVAAAAIVAPPEVAAADTPAPAPEAEVAPLPAAEPITAPQQGAVVSSTPAVAQTKARAKPKATPAAQVAQAGPLHRTSAGSIGKPAAPASTTTDDEASHLSAVTVANLVKQWQSQLNLCYTEYGLKVNPALTGSIAVHLAIRSSGDVGAATFTRHSWSGAGGAEAELCMREKVMAWMFPPASTPSAHEFTVAFAP
jgi:hypothetical protein